MPACSSSSVLTAKRCFDRCRVIVACSAHMVIINARRRWPGSKPDVPRTAERLADWAGPFGAVFAALCCLGVSWIIASITAAGLGFLRSDPILWPLMIASILFALWGMWRGRQVHRTTWPLLLGTTAGSALVAGVIFVHGFPARELIYVGSIGLIAASIWNAIARGRCERRLNSGV